MIEADMDGALLSKSYLKTGRNYHKIGEEL
jgi:hypothetical protein